MPDPTAREVLESFRRWLVETCDHIRHAGELLGPTHGPGDLMLFERSNGLHLAIDEIEQRIAALKGSKAEGYYDANGNPRTTPVRHNVKCPNIVGCQPCTCSGEITLGQGSHRVDTIGDGCVVDDLPICPEACFVSLEYPADDPNPGSHRIDTEAPDDEFTEYEFDILWNADGGEVEVFTSDDEKRIPTALVGLVEWKPQSPILGYPLAATLERTADGEAVVEAAIEGAARAAAIIAARQDGVWDVGNDPHPPLDDPNPESDTP